MKKSLGLIGVGAFGTLASHHLAPHFDLILHDTEKNVSDFATKIGARIGTLGDAASADIVILAVPVQKIRAALKEIAPYVRPDALVLDVASVKIKPVAAMEEILLPPIALVGTHPLFGPQSGKNGIAGLTIVLCESRGGRADEVENFCVQKLGLKTMRATAEEHDRQAAYVQGLTHMISQIVASIDLPSITMKTRTYEFMMQMVDMVRHDSDDLFRAIAQENPFSAEAKQAFFSAARALDERLSKD